jgi:hypothetical protein
VNGIVDVGEKSSPEIIESRFSGVSKSDFKKALGLLFKKGICMPGPNSIALSKPALVASNTEEASAQAALAIQATQEAIAAAEESNLPLKRLNAKSFLKFTSLKTFYLGSLPAAVNNSDIADHIKNILSTDPMFVLRDRNNDPVTSVSTTPTLDPAVTTKAATVTLPLNVRIARDSEGIPKGYAHVDIPFQNDTDGKKSARAVELLNRSTLSHKQILCKETAHFEDWIVARPSTPPPTYVDPYQRYKSRRQLTDAGGRGKGKAQIPAPTASSAPAPTAAGATSTSPVF